MPQQKLRGGGGEQTQPPTTTDFFSFNLIGFEWFALETQRPWICMQKYLNLHMYISLTIKDNFLLTDEDEKRESR